MSSLRPHRKRGVGAGLEAGAGCMRMRVGPRIPCPGSSLRHVVFGPGAGQAVEGACVGDIYKLLLRSINPRRQELGIGCRRRRGRFTAGVGDGAAKQLVSSLAQPNQLSRIYVGQGLRVSSHARVDGHDTCGAHAFMAGDLCVGGLGCGSARHARGLTQLEPVTVLLYHSTSGHFLLMISGGMPVTRSFLSTR